MFGLVIFFGHNLLSLRVVSYVWMETSYLSKIYFSQMEGCMYLRFFIYVSVFSYKTHTLLCFLFLPHKMYV